MPETQPKGPLHVLVVEDCDGDVAMVRRAFFCADVPCGLHVARDGREALDYLFRRGRYRDAPRPDLVLLDLGLPVVNGIDVLRRVKADPDLATIPVVVLTGSRDEEAVQQCLPLGSEGYLVKPLDVADVRYWAGVTRGAA